MQNEDIFGSLAAGRGPYGGKRGQARMEQMKENIVKEWEEEQRKKNGESSTNSPEVTKSNEDTKRVKETKIEEQSIAGSSLTADTTGGQEIKQKKSWRDGLRNLVGK